ncbi:hypothetical protein QVZ43_08580 [Marinobacter sp. chi1]|uniref:IPTL-CTERM sorting domain-containing protein n=1 Tax=Marinobacter suaedae TaxID=3057675 RepID=A0ABT8W0S9_9GAMM|nr:hypothetical protein [Marinobacter sp. chi1]MDO3721781.1 hypothetical protein [Marinobacter sp. chi1]
MTIRFLLSGLAVLLLTFCSTAFAIPLTYELEDSHVELYGGGLEEVTTIVQINGIRVNQSHYSVTFDGRASCISVFDGCDNPDDDFAFQTEEDARSASKALWYVVDSITFSLGSGFNCFGRIWHVSQTDCLVITPYGLEERQVSWADDPVPFLLHGALNIGVGGDPRVIDRVSVSTSSDWFVDQDAYQYINAAYPDPFVYAKWTRITPPFYVDETSLYSLLVLSLSMMLFARYRKRDSTT